MNLQTLLPPCLLCGTTQASIFRCKAAGPTQTMVQSNVKPTPFAYVAIKTQLDAMADDNVFRMCAPCAQWSMRTERSSTKTMFLVDQFVCSCMQLYTANNPYSLQSRVYMRMLRTLRDRENYLRASLPPLVVAFVDRFLQNQHSTPTIHMMQTWWYVHNAPQILPNKILARAVRLMDTTTDGDDNTD